MSLPTEYMATVGDHRILVQIKTIKIMTTVLITHLYQMEHVSSCPILSISKGTDVGSCFLCNACEGAMSMAANIFGRGGTPYED